MTHYQIIKRRPLVANLPRLTLGLIKKSSTHDSTHQKWLMMYIPQDILIVGPGGSIVCRLPPGHLHQPWADARRVPIDPADFVEPHCYETKVQREAQQKCKNNLGFLISLTVLKTSKPFKLINSDVWTTERLLVLCSCAVHWNRSNFLPSCGPQRCKPRLSRSRAPSVEAYDFASLKQILMCIYISKRDAFLYREMYIEFYVHLYLPPTKSTAVKSSCT